MTRPLSRAIRAALYRFERTGREHLPINQQTARAMVRRGLAEFVQPHGNIRLTEKGKTQ